MPQTINGLTIPDNLPSSVAKSATPTVVNGLTIPDNIAQRQNSPPTASDSTNIGDKLASAANSIRSGAYAFARGSLQSMDSVAATVNKAVAKYTGLGGVSPSDIQSGYESNTSSYNQNPDVKAHPWPAGAGRVAGGLVATAPVMAAIPELGSLFGGAAAETGIGAAGQAAAKAAGLFSGNIAQGTFQGGLMTSPGQGDSIINTQGARTGAIMGAAMTPIQMLGQGYLSGAKNYEEYANTLKAQGYMGSINGTDVPANQGWLNNTNKAIANNVVSQIPFVNKLPVIGMQAGRLGQQADIKDTITNMVQNIASSNPEGTATTFKNQVLRVANDLNSNIANKSQILRNQLQADGITTHALSPETTQATAQQILDSAPKSGPGSLTTPVQTSLNKIINNPSLSTNDLIGSVDKNGTWNPGIKQQLYAESQRLGQDPLNTPAYETAPKLTSLYNNINNDIQASTKNNINSLTAWHDFNQTVQFTNQLRDNAPLFGKAIENVSKDSTEMQNFYNALKVGKMGPDTANKYASLVGPDAMKSVNQGQLQDAFLKSGGSINTSDDLGKAITQNFNGNTLNLSKFVDQVTNNAPGTGGQVIKQPMVDTLKGLLNFAQTVQQGVNATTKGSGLIGNTTKAGLLGAASYGIGTPVMGTILGSAQAMGAIIRNAPLKNTLMLLNKLPGASSGTSQYLLEQANKQLIKAGVSLSHDTQGNTTLDMRTE